MTTNLFTAKTILLLKIGNVITNTNKLISQHKDQIKMGHLVIKNHKLQCLILNIKSRSLSRVSLKELNAIYSQAVDLHKEAES